MPQTVSLDFDWRFALGDDPAFASPAYDDGGWRPVDLPHDWSVEGTFSPDNPAGGAGAWAPTGVAWYRKRLVEPGVGAGGPARLEFDGVYRRALVYLNGELLGSHSYGFSGFAFELGPRLLGGGRDLVAVRVDSSGAPTCRWYAGSGIYRSVRLAFHGDAWIPRHGLSVATPRVGRKGGTAVATVEILRSWREDLPVRLEASILGPDGSELRRVVRRLPAGPGSASALSFSAAIPSPFPWSPGSPSLYRLTCRLRRGEETLDEATLRFGFRRAEFRPGRGFFLNGEPTKLKGVCLHGDGGAVGTAVPEAVWRRRLSALKRIGCNAIRCAHNPPDPGFLDLCDELGFLVVDEIFDKWEGRAFKPEEWYMRQAGFAEIWRGVLEDSIRRDRSRPCVVLWSVGNEAGQPGSPEFDSWLETLCGAARAADPTRPVSAAFVGSNAPTPEGRARAVMESASKVDVLCVNYQEPLYPRFHALDPGMPILGSESFIHWRGDENTAHAFGLRNPWRDAAENGYVAGQFLWPGIDYLGESPSWPLKGWDVGLLDTTGRLKPAGQYHRAAWSGKPMVALAVRDHGLGRGERALSWAGYSLSAHWNWPEFEREKRWPEVGGRLIEVEAQTNCESVELFLNGRSCGERLAADFPNGAVLFLVPYQPGSLRAVGRNGGRESAGDELRTAGPAAALRLSTDKGAIGADGRDLAHVEIELVDADGLRVPREDRLIRVSVDGPARLLGLDNGVLDSEEGYQGGSRSTGGGYLLALVGRARRPGPIELAARAESAGGGALEGGIRLLAT